MEIYNAFRVTVLLLLAGYILFKVYRSDDDHEVFYVFVGIALSIFGLVLFLADHIWISLGGMAMTALGVWMFKQAIKSQDKRFGGN